MILSECKKRDIATYAPTFFVFLFSTFFLIKFIFLAEGNILNQYPYISVDGYEWYTNGVYIYEAFRNGTDKLPLITVLRPPLYPLFTLLDYINGERGYILGLLASCCIFLSYTGTINLCSIFNTFSKEKNIFVYWCIALAYTLSPINFLRPYLLADSLAVTLSIYSIVFLVKFFEFRGVKYLFISSILCLLAGITQTYGLIPYIIFLTFYIIFNKENSSQKNKIVLILFLLCVPIIYFFIIYFWRHLIPHLTTPDNFIFFEFTSKNFNFYKNTWSFLLWPVILIMILFNTFSFKINFVKSISQFKLIILLIIATFAILAFFYQWKESRFTYFLWPWLIIFVFSTIKEIKGLTGLLCIAIFAFSSLIAPSNYWTPEFKGAKVTYKNWAYDFLASKSIDRNLLNCTQINCHPKLVCHMKCEGNTYFNDFDRLSNGTGRTLSTYLFIKNRSFK